MWWGGCEFWGSESVQRGKYPGFREDSEERFVTLGSLSCRASVIPVEWNPKRCRGTGSRLAEAFKRRPVKRENWGRGSAFAGKGSGAKAPKPAWLWSESGLHHANPGRTRYSRGVAAGRIASFDGAAPMAG